jgi:hypothetical protein
MSAFQHTMNTELSPEEWTELQSLREAITLNPASVHPMKMEKFTELFSRSIGGKGEGCSFKEPTNY